MRYTWLAWMISAYSVSVTGDVLLKKGYIWSGAVLYAASTLPWVQVMRYKDLSYIAVTSAVIGNAMLLLAAHFCLGESMSAKQWVGAALGLAAVALME